MAFEIGTWWREITDPRPLLIAGALTLGCVVAGPFGTIDLSLMDRVIYWVPLNLMALFWSTLCFDLFDRGRITASWPAPVRIALGALLFATPFTGVAIGMTVLIFSVTLEALPLFGSVLLIAVVIRVVVGALSAQKKPTSPDAQDTSRRTARIWKRLPPKLGRELVRLSVQDHYTEVHTTLGTELLLLRFTDALEEVEGIAGYRTHRSHWVATAAISEKRRRDGRLFLLLRDGTEVPVSRTYLPDLKEAGIV
jgi:hypothetical protein